MTADSAPSAAPARVLGPIDFTCIVVGAIIGVGIFFNPSGVARLTQSGSLALLAWAIAGGIALCGALTFAALGSRYHANGAHYEVLRDAFGPFPAFLFVFCNATAIQASAAGVIALICADNLAAAAGKPPLDTWTRLGVAAVLIVGLMGANIAGVRWGSFVQNLTVYLKVATLVVVTVLAAASAPAEAPVRPEQSGEGLHPAAAVLAALVPCLFAYGGWQHSLWISGEVRDPERNLPRAIIGGVALVVVVYLAANWAYLRLLGVERVAASQALAADAVAVVWPGTGARLIGAAVGVSAFGVLNAQLLSGPRLVYGMARDGRFFGIFGRLSPGMGTPVAAIALIGGMALVLLAVSGQKAVALLTTAAVYIDAVFFAFTGVALFILRSRAGAKLPAIGFPVVPALFVLGELGIIVGSFLDKDVSQAAIAGTVWIAAAALVYAVWFRRGQAPE